MSFRVMVGLEFVIVGLRVAGEMSLIASTLLLVFLGIAFVRQERSLMDELDDVKEEVEA